MATQIRTPRLATPRVMMRRRRVQLRSRETVETLVSAAAGVLSRRGWVGFTTNEVVDVAGVSIGSLYQYFPNKAALVAAIERRHFADLMRVYREACGTDESLSLFERVECLVRGIIGAHTVDPVLHRVLTEEVPRNAAAAFDGDFPANEVWSLLRSVIESGAYAGANPDVVARIVAGCNRRRRASRVARWRNPLAGISGRAVPLDLRAT